MGVIAVSWSRRDHAAFVRAVLTDRNIANARPPEYIPIFNTHRRCVLSSEGSGKANKDRLPSQDTHAAHGIRLL